MKKLLLVAVLLVSASIAFAQDKYEFMTINYYITMSRTIAVSIDGKEFLSEKVESPKEKEWLLDTTPLLLKVKEYQDKGWEVMSFNTAGGGGIFYIAYLRKKKTN